jgi:hypothetical protein
MSSRTTTVTQRPPDVESQLAAMASAADRANRPAVLIAAPVLLLLAALIGTVWAITDFNGARVRWSNQAKSVSDINQMMFRVKEREASTPDIDALYPRSPFMPVQLRDIAGKVWGVEGEGTIPLDIRNRSEPSPFSGTSDLGRVDVPASGAVDDLNKVFEFMKRVPESEFLSRAFVSQLRIQPAGPQWQVNIQFSLYEKLKG